MLAQPGNDRWVGAELAGVFGVRGYHHGKPYFKCVFGIGEDLESESESESVRAAFLSYWRSEVDDEAETGWWFGLVLGGDSC